jgi:opacity protein-like surface antigen
MKRKFLAIAIVLPVMGIWAPSALALDPMGPPAAGLKQGGMSLGLDYSYSQINLKLKNGEEYETVDNKVEKTYANLGYGIADDWNVFGRLGGSKLEGEDLIFYGAYGLAWGLGTKVTIYQDVDITWGALFQISWGKSMERSEGTYEKLKWHEYQIAAGPTYRLTDNVSIYGGPFYSYLKGTDSDEAGKLADIKGKDQTGGYIGGQFDFTENVTLNAEYQLSDGASGMGLMLVWKF